MKPSSSDITSPPPPLSEPRGKFRTPPGHRILHLVIPDSTFALLHKAAIDSHMRFSHYMGRFLREALPYERSDISQTQSSTTSTPELCGGGRTSDKSKLVIPEQDGSSPNDIPKE